jgi:hypothetical protein
MRRPQVYRIVGTFRTATQIVLSDETIQHVALGDTVSWEVAVAGHILFLKPRERAGPTNLIVTTSRGGELRSYAFELTARSGPITGRNGQAYFRSVSAIRGTTPTAPSVSGRHRLPCRRRRWRPRPFAAPSTMRSSRVRAT